jgi:hypothetical protein
MNRSQIFLISIFFTIGINLFSLVSGKAVRLTAPLFTVMGEHHYAITTKSSETQHYLEPKYTSSCH